VANRHTYLLFHSMINRPFSEENFNTFVEMVPTINGRHAPNGLPEYSILFQQIPFPHFLSGEVVDLISRLLDVNDKSRLGSGPNGVKNIKEHRFFQSIDWDLLESKQLDPPFIPEAKKLEESPMFTDFETMMKDLGKASWLSELPKADDQKYFSTW
jgi:serine/threonine protein kinase